MAQVVDDVGAKILSCPLEFTDYVHFVASRLGYNTTLDCVVEDNQLTIVAKKGKKVISQPTVLKNRILEPGTVVDLILASMNGE